MFPDKEWELIYVNYTNVVVYPAVWLVRKWRAWRPAKAGAEVTARTEDRMPPRPLNALLRAVFAGLGRCPVPFPFGVSLVLVAKRRP